MAAASQAKAGELLPRCRSPLGHRVIDRAKHGCAPPTRGHGLDERRRQSHTGAGFEGEAARQATMGA